jgi:hypothetical protein
MGATAPGTLIYAVSRDLITMRVGVDRRGASLRLPQGAHAQARAERHE